MIYRTRCIIITSVSTETLRLWLFLQLFNWNILLRGLWSFISFKVFQRQDVSLGRMPLGGSRGTPNNALKKACHYKCIFTVLTKKKKNSWGTFLFANMTDALNIFFCFRMRKSTKTFPVRAYNLFFFIKYLTISIIQRSSSWLYATEWFSGAK